MEETIEQFLARGGKVAKVAADTRDHDQMRADEKAMRLAVRGERSYRSNDNDLINERHVVVDHMGRQRVRNGLGEWIA